MMIRHMLWKAAGGVYCLGGSPPPPPNYAPMAASSDYAANLGYTAANNQLAFQQQVYNNNLPMVKQAQQAMVAQANQQTAMSQQAQQIAADANQQYQTLGKPLEAQMATDAGNMGSVAQQNTAAGTAVSDVKQQSASTQASMQRNMASMGVNPNSGEFASMSNSNAINNAAMSAGAATNARTNAFNSGLQAKAAAASYFSGKNATSFNGINTATNAGNAGSAAMSGASTAGLAGAQLMNSGYGAQMSAAGLGLQAASNNANFANMGYSNAMSGFNAQQQQIGQIAGMAGMAMGTPGF